MHLKAEIRIVQLLLRVQQQYFIGTYYKKGTNAQLQSSHAHCRLQGAERSKWSYVHLFPDAQCSAQHKLEQPWGCSILHAGAKDPRKPF